MLGQFVWLCVVKANFLAYAISRARMQFSGLSGLKGALQNNSSFHLTSPVFISKSLPKILIIYVTRHEKTGLCTQNTPVHIIVNISLIV